MDCEQVFFILTSGPFPSGAATDDAVEAHLGGCRGCWRIAEALRPADDLGQEAAPSRERRNLPGYRGDAPPPEPVIALNTHAAAGAPRTQPTLLPAPARVARRQPVYTPPPNSTLRDLSQIAGFLTLVTTAACGLSWFFS